jgi:hypothetical protein
MLTELPTARQVVEAFMGYNHNLRIGGGEFYDMTNLSSDSYPVLSPRAQRGVYATTKNPQGLIAKDALCYVDNIAEGHSEGARFYINEHEVIGLKLSSRAEDCPKTLVSMGAYVIILPDKKWVNTSPSGKDEDGNYEYEHGNIEEEVTTPNGQTVSLKVCKADGGEYIADHEGETAPADPTDGMCWFDTSTTPPTIKNYSESNAMWISVASHHAMIKSVGIGEHFEVGDGVNISGITSDNNQDLNGDMIIQAKGDDYIVVTGFAYDATQTTPVTVKRQMPIMDFVIESGNRLWGCHYGVAHNGEVVNEIYASKLGDFKNWSCYAGLSTDSYAATVGTDGQFTGAITHLGYPLFFKENCVHKVYGNFPANFQIQTTACRGVQKGSHKSLAIVNETLFYKSQSSICAYDGSLPVEASSALGDVSYHNAVAGSLGNKYYISMSDANGKYHLFVFDTAKGMWHREDDMQAECFCNCRGHLYYVDYDTNKIKVIRGTGIISKDVAGVTEDKPIEWEAVTGIIGTDSPDKKYISRMDVRMSLAVGARVSFYAEYDSSGEWEHLFTMDGVRLRTFAVPIRPQRCDHMRLKIIGSGEAKIYSICKTIEQGSDA